jgi:hypothetical protein
MENKQKKAVSSLESLVGVKTASSLSSGARQPIPSATRSRSFHEPLH